MMYSRACNHTFLRHSHAKKEKKMKDLPYRCIYERHGRWSGMAAGAAWPSESLSIYIVLLKPRAIRTI
jgi:hypothetical protein